MLDKRRHPRFACDLTSEILVGGQKMTARAIDVSRGGLCLSCDRRLTVPSEVSVRLTLIFGSNKFSEPLLLPARVMWCTQLPDEHQVGVMFRNLSTEQAQFLDMFLRFLRGELIAQGEGVAPDEDVEDENDPDAEPFG